MQYVLDTNICSYILKQHPAEIRERFSQLRPSDLCISCVTLHELLFGVYQNPQSRKVTHKIITTFAENINVLVWNREAADHTAQIRDVMKRNGHGIETADLFIAGHARSIKATLVTNNVKHFKKVPDILIENWVK